MILLDDFTYLLYNILAVLFGIFFIAFIFIILILITSPALPVFLSKLKKHAVLLSIYRRDGVHKFKIGEYTLQHIRTKDGYYIAYPKVAGVNKGIIVATCYEETGTPLHPYMAAACGLLKSYGIQDAEICQLFELWKRMKEEGKEQEFKRILQFDENYKDFLNSKVYPRCTWKELITHVLQVYNNNVERVIDVMKEIDEKIPEDNPTHPVWYDKEKKAIACNVLGEVIYWDNIKDFQIYHSDPSMIMTAVKTEALRLAQKYFKDRTDLILKSAIAFAIIIGVIVFGYLILRSGGGIVIP
ncbi:MAG: hypothetical protein QW119_05315 [Candidatus Methanomethylicaceae archaeon]